MTKLPLMWTRSPGRVSVGGSALAAAALLLCLDLSADAFAASVQVPDHRSLETRLDRIEQMVDSVDDLTERDRDGLLFRIDEEILALQGELVGLSRSIAKRREDGVTEDTDPNEQLRDRMDRALALSVSRIADLGQRIEVELATYEEFSDSSDTIISRAFVQELRRIRLRHMTAIMDQFEQRVILALPQPTEIRRQLEQGLDLATERLIGQIRLDAMTLEDLRARIATDPSDGALRSALRAVERKQSGNLDAAGRIIALLSRMERDTTELRALQAQQRGLIGAEILDSDVFMSLMDDRLEMAREKLILGAPVWILRLLGFLAVLVAAWLIARGARAIVRRITTHESVELGDLRERTLVSLAYSTVLLVGFVLALSALGVSLVPLLAGLGVASIIVGLALQESLGNLAAGGMILLTRPFDLHDRIRVGNAEGTVKDMSLVATTIASHDNKMLVIPNRQIWSSTITNFTRARIRRIDVEISIPCGSDLASAERLLRRCIEAEDRVLDKPEPLIHFGNVSGSSVSFWVRAWVQTSDVDPVSIAMRRSIAECLRANGIDAGVHITQDA